MHFSKLILMSISEPSAGRAGNTIRLTKYLTTFARPSPAIAEILTRGANPTNPANPGEGGEGANRCDRAKGAID